jgi:hypothetical protein
MKKISKIITATSLLMAVFALFAFTKNTEGEIKGWMLRGNAPKSYEIGILNDAARGGNVGFMKSINPKISKDDFGTIMQSFFPQEYLGKRVKLSGYIKSSDVNTWAGMWMRVDGEKKKVLSFDNMQDRPIKGTTEWKKYEIILDVPDKSKLLAYGVLVSGSGSVWFDDFKFEVVEKTVNTTSTCECEDRDAPTNTSFEETH